MKYPMLSLCVATIATMSSSAFAATYYLSDCKAGAAPGCVAGTSTNDGLTPSTPKQLYSQLPARQGGDKVLFAKGGAWVDASMGIYVPTASVTTPVTWDSYTPAWGGTAKPILTEARVGKYLFNFDDAGRKAADGGYVIRNLDLRGGGVMGGVAGGQGGVFGYWSVNDLLMENLEISGFKLAVYMAHSPNVSTGWENNRITLRNSYLHDNQVASFMGGAADIVIENNILDHNGTAALLDHDIYVSSMTRGIIRNNTITRTTLDANGKCAASVIVVHGKVNGLVVEKNKIIQPAGSTAQCFGIEVSGGYADTNGAEGFHNVEIRGNTIVDVGYIGVGLRSCTDCIVESNSIIWNAATGNQGVSMNVNTPSSLDERGNGLTIRNNSIYMATASGTPTGISLNNDGATGHSVTANVIYFGSTVNAGARCFDHKTYTAADFKPIDRNLCYRVGGKVVYSPTYASLPLAQAASFDINGLSVDPMFVAMPSASNAYSLAVQSTSPAVNLGINLKVDVMAPAAPTMLSR